MFLVPRKLQNIGTAVTVLMYALILELLRVLGGGPQAH